jgi:hypothetical protein
LNYNTGKKRKNTTLKKQADKAEKRERAGGVATMLWVSTKCLSPEHKPIFGKKVDAGDASISLLLRIYEQTTAPRKMRSFAGKRRELEAKKG